MSVPKKREKTGIVWIVRYELIYWGWGREWWSDCLIAFKAMSFMGGEWMEWLSDRIQSNAIYRWEWWSDGVIALFQSNVNISKTIDKYIKKHILLRKRKTQAMPLSTTYDDRCSHGLPLLGYNSLVNYCCHIRGATPALSLSLSFFFKFTAGLARAQSRRVFNLEND